jgi:thiol-disulfide isomerase/thioredoxin
MHMKPAIRRSFIGAILAALISSLGNVALPAQTAESPDAARLNSLYSQRDYERVVIEADKLSSPSPEAQAWRAMALAKRGYENDGLAAAQKLTADFPNNGWSWIALSSVRQSQGDHVEEAIRASERAIALLPDQPAAIVVRINALASDAARRDEAIALADAKRTAVANAAAIVVAKASTLMQQGYGRTRDEAKIKAALDTFAEARSIDPKNVDAWYLAGSNLTSLRRGEEALPLLKAAAEAAPDTTGVQAAYWRALNNRTGVDPAAKLSEIQSLMDAFLARNGNRPGALYGASSVYDDLKLLDKKKALQDRIMAEFPDSIDAEWVLAYRWREYEGPGYKPDNPEFRRLLVMFLERPKRHHEGLLGEAYMNMFGSLMAEAAPNPKLLLPVVRGMAQYETMNVHITYGSALVQLADKKVLLDEAEMMGRKSVDVMTKKVASQKEFYKGDGEYERAMSTSAARGYDALGWVLFAESKNAEAEKTLLKSYELNHEDRQNLFHLGKFYEGARNLDKAVDYYVKGLSVSMPGVNPSEAALKTIFEAKNTGKSFDDYLAELREADRTRRRTKIMGERDAQPKAVPAFNLKTLDGKMVSLDSLKGKVVAINFWGIWCGWCVQELPDFQKLHEQYKNDPDVVILTIDNDQNPNDVPPWMAQKKFSFPVLLDDGFVGTKAGITAFPTTWFLDREGRLAFTKVGWSEKLVEEFGWRIEAIRK